MSRGCGSCNLCCKLLQVPDIGKPARMQCWWTGIHGGCARQNEKPRADSVVYNEVEKKFELLVSESGKDLSLAACAQFKCLWLESQEHSDETKRQPRHMRPDITHVMLGPPCEEDETLLYVQVDSDHPAAWRGGIMREYLNDLISRGGKLEVIIGDDTRIQISEPF